MKFRGRSDELFEIVDINNSNKALLNEHIEGQLTVLWFTEDGNKLQIDLEERTFDKDVVICLTSFSKVKVHTISQAKFIRFNSPFYCILNHDSEVGCKGVLFFGARNIPVLYPTENDLKLLDNLVKTFYIEMESKDELQLEMLQMLLKRLLILCTRIYKTQENFNDLSHDQQDIVREFNFLVEQHFKTKHSVSEYAELLNKSPKTLSNLFGKFHDRSPLQLIQHRIMLEVRRLLTYTSRPISEIAYEVGFNDPQSFSRFFKKNEGQAPSEYRLSQSDYSA